MNGKGTVRLLTEYYLEVKKLRTTQAGLFMVYIIGQIVSTRVRGIKNIPIGIKSYLYTPWHPKQNILPNLLYRK